LFIINCMNGRIGKGDGLKFRSTLVGVGSIPTSCKNLFKITLGLF